MFFYRRHKVFGINQTPALERSKRTHAENLFFFKSIYILHLQYLLYFSIIFNAEIFFNNHASINFM